MLRKRNLWTSSNSTRLSFSGNSSPPIFTALAIMVACDLERVEVLLELNGPAVADRPDVGDLCFAFLSLPVKPEIIVAESHNSLAAVALKDLVRVKDESVEARR